MKNKGFTLIELLVVVLIIGILAAIAVPQYQKSVEKSRAMQALTILRSYVDAQEAYYLAHGEYATSTSNLDITLPKLEKWKFIASFNREDPQIAIGAKDNSLWFAYYTHIKKMFCATKTKHEICESFPVIKEDCYGNDLAQGWSCYYFK